MNRRCHPVTRFASLQRKETERREETNRRCHPVTLDCLLTPRYLTLRRGSSLPSSDAVLVVLAIMSTSSFGRRSCNHTRECGSSPSCENRKRKADSDVLDVRDLGSPVRRRVLVASHVVGGRTFPGELSRYIIAGYKNPRVFCGLSSGDESHFSDPARRKTFCPSQVQAAAVLSKCIPRHLSESFTMRFLHHQGLPTAGSKWVHDAIPPGAQVCKTFVSSIHRALVDTFGVGNVSVEQCQFMKCDRDKTCGVAVPHVLEIIVLDAVLARSKKVPRPLSSTRATVDTPVKMRIDDISLKEPCHDHRFRALVAVLPEAGVFYCHRERRKVCVGVPNTHVPLDINWLRVVKNGKKERRFGKGGYVTRLWGGDPDCVWRWRIHRGSPKLVIPDRLTGNAVGITFDKSPPKSVYHVQQCADEDSPRLPPDYIWGADFHSTRNTQELRRDYLEKYLQSTSARRGCRHYVAGYLHHHINPDSVWIIDPEKEGDVDVNVSVHIRHYQGNNMVALFRDSVIQVRYLPALGRGALDLVGLVRDHAASVRRSRGASGVRANQGDLGSMHPVGTRIERDLVTRTQYVASSTLLDRPVLGACVRAAAQLASESVPAVLRVMQDMEDDADLKPSGGMRGDGASCRVSHTMDVSVDLANSSHYDVNDASQGFSIWTEDEPGTTTDWYFVLPNVFGKKNSAGTTYNGMAIKLTHGVLISWDGRLIRHCTSMMQRKKDCHVYGTFFAAKTAIVRYGVQRAIALEQKRRGQVGKHNRSVAPRSDAEDLPEGIVDETPTEESKVVVGDVNGVLVGRCGVSPSLACNWMDGFESDLGLGDEGDDEDDSSVDEGVPASDAVGEGVSDDLLVWDNCRNSASMHTAISCDAPSSSAPEDDYGGVNSTCTTTTLHLKKVDDAVTIGKISARSLTLERNCEKAVHHESTKGLPNLLPLVGQETCGVCDLLCVNNRGSKRDALHFVCAGGRYRTMLDPREPLAPSPRGLTGGRRTPGYACRYLHRPINDGSGFDVRIYYPYFLCSRNGESETLFDILQPSEVTASHLVRASHILVPCPHLQYHFEEFWKLFLPGFTTLRTGVEWILDVPWYYVRMVACKTQYPHVQSYGCAYDTWIKVNDCDWRTFDDAIRHNVMIGVSGECGSDRRMIAIQSLTAGTFLGGNRVFFPTKKLRDVFRRKFEPFLPPGARAQVGEQESDGSRSCPHGENRQIRLYYFLVKVPAATAGVASLSDTCPNWTDEVTSGALSKYEEDDGLFCYDLNSPLYDERLSWYKRRFMAAKEVPPMFQWKSLESLSTALQSILTLQCDDDHRDVVARHATETMVLALRETIGFGLRYAMIFDRMCLSIKHAIARLPSRLVDNILSAFASMITTLIPDVILVHALACDDVFLLRKLILNFVRTMPFTTKDGHLIEKTINTVMPSDLRGLGGAGIVGEPVQTSRGGTERLQPTKMQHY